MASEDWTWRFSRTATEQFEDLEGHVQDRIVSKLDEVVEASGATPASTSNRSLAVPSTSYASGSIDSPAC